MAATAYEQTAAGQASNFGWSLAVINSNPELKALFAQATSTGAGGGWTTDHFVAKVRDTKWFKANADTARQTLILQKADPATYRARVASAAATAASTASSIGANVGAWWLNKIATDSVMFGWNSDQLKATMGQFVTPDKNGQFFGGAATIQYQYTQMAQQYGVQVSRATMGTWVKNTARGVTDTDGVRNWMIANASSRYPSLADRLKGGETVAQIAEPYVQSYAKTLELNPNAIPLTDKLVQGALAAKDAKGQPSTKSVWEFEQDLRNDPRFMKTQQAQDSSMAMAHQVLSDWGVKS